MNDWYECSPAEKALIDSCAPNETCILFGSQGVHKLPIQAWKALYREALKTAYIRAAESLGIDCAVTGDGRLDIGEAVPVADDWDMVESSITVQLEHQGRRAVGMAYLYPPKAH